MIIKVAEILLLLIGFATMITDWRIVRKLNKKVRETQELTIELLLGVKSLMVKGAFCSFVSLVLLMVLLWVPLSDRLVLLILSIQAMFQAISWHIDWKARKLFDNGTAQGVDNK